MSGTPLTNAGLLVMSALLRLDNHAYGVPIVEELCADFSGRWCSSGEGCPSCKERQRDETISSTELALSVESSNAIIPLGEGDYGMPRVKLFVGSAGSSSSLRVAGLIANDLEGRGCADVVVWNEGVFTLNEGVLERLVKAATEYDFAVMIWGPDDVTDSKGESEASPRDNVIFECGLFMGRLGRDRVFIVCDSHVDVKMPSDFAGITVAKYDGERAAGKEGQSAVRDACGKIEEKILEVRFPELVGAWRSRFVMNADLDHREVTDDLNITPSIDGILINSLASKVEPYTAVGRVLGNQVIGEWRHKKGENYVEGVFMLIVNPRADVMYGYCTGRDERAAMIFATWVLVKTTGFTDAEIEKRFSWGQRTVREYTVGPALRNVEGTV